jgi:CelD/BcsL family acetyltransferase involved in cellulose biosynthesis
VSALTARRWSIEEWLASESAWDGLLARTQADALFLSWPWLTHWWRYYGNTLGLDPRILAFYRDGELVGLAPLYMRRVVRLGLVRARSVQVIGLAWRDPVPLISEYLDVIAAPQDLDAVRNECVRALLEEPGWNELVIGFTSSGEEWRAAFARQVASRGHYMRTLEPSISYHADLTHGFAAYLRDLGQSTRRSVWNLRRRLSEEHGEVRLEFLAAAEIDSGFDDLNRLHQLRWNRPAFAGERLELQKSFARWLAEHGELAFTRLRVAGNVVSVLYDIRKGARQYNLKMGFDPHLTNRLSLGLVHFGYAMEAAQERGVTVYDFLAGPGQSFDFKRNLGQLRRELTCVQLLRGAVLPRLYRWRDRVR